MSNVFFDQQWEIAMRQLVDVLAIEVPSFSFLGPQNLSDYSRIYIKYYQVYRMLEDCYHQIIHPQKRIDCLKSLEAVIGRILELKHWMVFLNAGKEIIYLEDLLLNLELTPDALDVVPPRLLTADNLRNLETRDNFLIKVLQQEKEQHEQEGSADSQSPDSKFPVYTPEEAIAILQANERGRQARHRLATLAKTRFTQEEALKKQQAGHEPLTQEGAAVVMQSAARGFLERCRVKHSAEDELTLLGTFFPSALYLKGEKMNMYERNSDRDYAFGFMRETELRRKKNQLLSYQEYQDAMALAKEQIKELEGQEMREIIQEKINAWLNANRDPDTGLFPPFPKPADGGSKLIVFPPPKFDFEVETKKKKDAKKDDKKKKKKKASPFPPLVFPVDDEEKPPSCPAFFLRHVRESVDVYTHSWHDKDDSANLAQKHDTDRLKGQLRPMVFEEIRLEVDQNTRVILDRVKKKILAELKAARKKQKKGAKEKRKEKKKDKDKDAPPPAKKKPKKPKDPTAQRTIESIYSELVKNGIVQLLPKRELSDYVSTETFYGPTFEVDPTGFDPTTAQVKRAVVEYCIMPLVSDFVHQNAPYIKSVLLYGAEGNGKTLLVHASARAAGAAYFNLSPQVLDGKYPGKQGAKMLQMVFKLARIMAPSVVHISGVEKLFVTDRKKIKTWGLKDKPNRIKKALTKEVKNIKPGERVLFLGTSSRPQDAPGKRPVFPNFFTKRIYVPFPDYGSRSRIWRALIERHGGVVTEQFNLSTISQLSDGFSVASIEKVCKTVLTEKRKRKLRRFPLTIKEVINDVHSTKPVDPAFHESLREWAKPKKPAEKKGGKDAKGKGKGKGKGKKK
ncbi:IQ and AAA domain-containing protein 1 isoform X2 [Selaginella moellendorffii]|uniref:IQ and AAA domain-containing protein 1 isoform X2 n=1 Tax=Selaginella moellendorffii TaxID=88036 RepID=UPI000D1D0537|nr:IQ and AAA domain-containing protein 1 isoform X2 [Selaginella moellendorffii]|eukprot:XP_024531716.1 IQ and AAA domain-containing protein 1 isoform X2 [Selaginella moellendorffii]